MCVCVCVCVCVCAAAYLSLDVGLGGTTECHGKVVGVSPAGVRGPASSGCLPLETPLLCLEFEPNRLGGGFGVLHRLWFLGRVCQAVKRLAILEQFLPRLLLHLLHLLDIQLLSRLLLYLTPPLGHLHLAYF